MLAIVLVVVQLSSDHSHLTTDPVCPDKVKVVPLLPEHTVAFELMLPPTEASSTVIVPVALLVPHPPVSKIE